MDNGSRTDPPYRGSDESRGWWTQRFEQTEDEGGQGRIPWTPEMRSAYRYLAASVTAPELCPAPLFYERILEQVEHARAQQWPLALVILQVHELPPEPHRQQALEVAVRLDVREGDIPARLGEATFGVLLPKTGSIAVVVAARLQRALSNITGKPVSTGVACYPDDATRASELLRLASARAS
jgi:hypothetical protein